LALGRVVRMRPCVTSAVTRLRNMASRCAVVRPRRRIDTRFFICGGNGGSLRQDGSQRVCGRSDRVERTEWRVAVRCD
jgi:hypothetical protein